MTARFDPFPPTGPRWYAIEAHRPFLEDLAAGVLAWLGDQAPETLSDTTILLPNRRAARAFTAALGRMSGERPVLLPQVRPLGDLEEDEPPFAPGELGLDLAPAIAPLARRFELARLVAEHRPDLTAGAALELGEALGRFLDSCQLEEIDDLSGVADLVEGELARHWEQSARFLAVAIEAWPRRLAELGLVDPAWRRARLLRLLAERWTKHPPTHPVIAAGSTGTAPAAADVLGAVARAPQGCVVLPGLDVDLDPGVWDTLKANEQHPQNALWRLLARHEVAREAVRPWPGPTDRIRPRARQRLINEALRPADATGDWRGVIVGLRAAAARERSADPIAEGLEGLSVVAVRVEEEAAAALGLMMRETLETPGRSCALVTPDIALGRRVAARLERWGIVADVSAGRSLATMPAGVLIDLVARWIDDPLDPHTLLGLLKHPLVRLDLGAVDVARATRTLERRTLRGPRPRDWDRLRHKLDQAAAPRDDGHDPSERTLADLAAARALTDRLETLAASALAAFSPTASLDLAARGLIEQVEAFAGLDVWAGPDGEAAAGLMTALIEGGASLGSVDRSHFRDLVSGLLVEQTVRTGGATHPALRILGPIEARLVRADRMILAGLEEGVWPVAAPTDPFLSRPMRETLGLPPPERRLGQTAQDFVQAACAEEVILVHSERRGGQPAVKSRWLWRLEMLTRGANRPGTPVTLDRPTPHRDWARALDAPTHPRPDYARRPAPTPPVRRRPRELPVTSVERWVRDPYAVHARYILGLKRLDRPGEAGDALVRGTAIHAALQRMSEDWPGDLPEACAPAIESFLVEALTDAGFDEAAMARELVLARNCAGWLAGFEIDRRLRADRRLIEARGRTTLPGPFAPFLLTARADRIDIGPGGTAVIDFKTGSVPSAKQVREHFAPQLTLTAAILADGGFETGPVAATELLYVKIIGRSPPGDVVDVSAPGRNNSLTAAQIAEAARDGLTRRIADFDREETAYVSWAAPQFMGTFGGNYDHLARVWEWHVVGTEEAESE